MVGSSGYYQVCMVADGLTLLQDNPAGFFVVMANGTDFTRLTVPNNNGLPVTDQFTYFGGLPPIAFGPAPAVVVGSTGTVSATGASSGYPITFTSLTPGVCTINGSTVTGVTAGTCTIAANQAANATYPVAPPQVTLNMSIARAATAITVSASGSIFDLGMPVTLTARVTVTPPGAGTPTGTVTFMDGVTALGNTPLVSSMSLKRSPSSAVNLNGSGQATLTFTPTTAGPHSISATYSGDANFSGSSSSATPLNVLVAIPTLNAYGLFLLAILLAGVGAWMIHRTQ